MKAKRKFTVVVDQQEDGFYVATVPALRGCHTQAKTPGAAAFASKAAGLEPTSTDTSSIARKHSSCSAPPRFISFSAARPAASHF